MELIGTQKLHIAAANALIADGLDAAKVRLFQTNVAVSKETVAADLTVATFVGYAPEDVTWNAPSIGDDGEVEVVGISGEFRPTSGATPNDIFGAWVTNDAGTDVLLVALFDDGPYPMNLTTDAIVLTLRYRPSSQSLIVSVS